MVRKDIKLSVQMVTVSLCLLPVIATGHRLTTQESTVNTGVLHLTRVVTTALNACSSIALTSLTFGSTASTGKVYGLSQNNKCSLPPFVFTRMEKTKRIKIFSGAF